MAPRKRYAKKQAKARQRRRLQAHERLARDRRQAQRAAEALHHALEDLGLPAAIPAARIKVLCNPIISSVR
jgi:transcription initiation factor TFIIIB Brf1 subunit/transcription initiation factor TFIIB